MVDPLLWDMTDFTISLSFALLLLSIQGSVDPYIMMYDKPSAWTM